MPDPRIAALEAALAANPPVPAPPRDPPPPRAAVALLLREGADGPELLLIRRAEREGDPWSGHMALPGGRAAPGDADAAATAAREAREEGWTWRRTAGCWASWTRWRPARRGRA